MVLMTLLLAGCGTQEVNYQNQKLGFEVSYPSNWKVSDSFDGISFISPQEKPPLPSFRVDVDEKNTESSDDEILRNTIGYDSSEKISISGFPASKNYNTIGEQIMIQLFVVKDKKLYTLTLGYPKNDEKVFIETKDMIINSFKLI